MLKRSRFTKVKVLFLLLVYVFNFDLFEFSAAILEKGLLLPYAVEHPPLYTSFLDPDDKSRHSLLV